jgi:hypothetical protein
MEPIVCFSVLLPCETCAVPRISSFFGIVIEMYFGDHPPPHFHARYSGESAKIEIATGAVLAGVSFQPGAAARARMGRSAS